MSKLPPCRFLTLDAISTAIASTCCISHNKDDDWVFYPARVTDVTTGIAATASSQLSDSLFGVVAKQQQTNGSNCIIIEQQHVSTFYFAYSSWNGRALYIDRIAYNSRNNQGFVLALFRALATIAISLDCVEVTWDRFKDEVLPFPATIAPVTDTRWLKMHWSSTTMHKFVTNGKEFVAARYRRPSCNRRTTIEMCLSGAQTDSSAFFHVRLADASDVDTICRFIQDMADYEMESNAVRTTFDNFDNDGFQTEQRLFYCLILESLMNNDNNNNNNNNNNVSRTCGMAFFFIGCTSADGRYMYLSDLYIDSLYRGRGGGKFIMGMLARIALSLRCSRMVWQVIHWNTSALKLYQTIGAKIVHGHVTSRFDMGQLHAVSSWKLKSRARRAQKLQ